MKSAALWHIDKESSVIRIEQLSKGGTSEVLIKSEYSLVSAGTEKSVALGLVGKEFEQYMSVPYMDGSFDLPLKYGYSLVGTVLSEGEYFNQSIHIMHPHQSQFYALGSNLHILSEDLNPEKAVLLSNMETVVNAIWDSEIGNDDTILICGFGGIGFLLAETIRSIFKAKIFVIESNEQRRMIAAENGFEVLSDWHDRQDTFNVAFNCSSTYQGLNTCIKAAGLEGRIIELSWYGNLSGNVNLGGSFHYLRKKIIASQVSKIPKQKEKEWNYYKRKRYAEELLKNVDLQKYEINYIPFNDSPLFFELLRNGNVPKALMHCIVYNN